MHLPGINGHEVLKFIRQQDHLKSIPVIIISADYAMSSANEDTADYLLMKPVDTRQLCLLVERILSAPSRVN